MDLRRTRSPWSTGLTFHSIKYVLATYLAVFPGPRRRTVLMLLCIRLVLPVVNLTASSAAFPALYSSSHLYCIECLLTEGRDTDGGDRLLSFTPRNWKTGCDGQKTDRWGFTVRPLRLRCSSQEVASQVGNSTCTIHCLTDVGEKLKHMFTTQGGIIWFLPWGGFIKDVWNAAWTGPGEHSDSLKTSALKHPHQSPSKLPLKDTSTPPSSIVIRKTDSRGATTMIDDQTRYPVPVLNWAAYLSNKSTWAAGYLN